MPIAAKYFFKNFAKIIKKYFLVNVKCSNS